VTPVALSVIGRLNARVPSCNIAAALPKHMDRYTGPGSTEMCVFADGVLGGSDWQVLEIDE